MESKHFHIVDKRIKFYSQNTNFRLSKLKSTFRYLQRGIQEVHRNWVLVSANKVAENVIAVRRLYYIQTLKQDVYGTMAYKETPAEEIMLLRW